MKPFVLYWRMLRYRAAVVVILFMLLGAASESLTEIVWPVVLAVLALASSYVCATSANDLADKEIDEINHSDDKARPLVTGAAETRDLWLLFGTSGVLAVAPLLVVDPPAAGIVALSLLVGALYSLPPVRLSHRALLAPPALAVAYAGLPYWLGAVVAGGRLRTADLCLPAALGLLFAGRILLKDFRDREGDAACGKETFLLRYGKPTTCLASLGAVCAGDALLVAALAEQWWLAILLQPYVLSVAAMLLRLYRAGGRRDEQLAIGVGARMGNGLLLTLLGVLLLANNGADRATQATFGLALMVLYAINFAGFLRRPDQADIGYKK